MESFLWLLELLSVVALCLWALKTEDKEEAESKDMKGAGRGRQQRSRK